MAAICLRLNVLIQYKTTKKTQGQLLSNQSVMTNTFVVKLDDWLHRK